MMLLFLTLLSWDDTKQMKVSSIIQGLPAGINSSDNISFVTNDHTFYHILATMRMLSYDTKIFSILPDFTSEMIDDVLEGIDGSDILFTPIQLIYEKNLSWKALLGRVKFLVVVTYDPPLSHMMCNHGNYMVYYDFVNFIECADILIPVRYGDYVIMKSILRSAVDKISYVPVYTDIYKDYANRTNITRTSDILSYIGLYGSGKRLEKHIPIIRKFSDRIVHIFYPPSITEYAELISEQFPNVAIHSPLSASEFLHILASCEFMVVPDSSESAISPIAMAACVRVPVFSVFSNLFAKVLFSDLMFGTVDDIDVKRLDSRVIEEAYYKVEQFSCSYLADTIERKYNARYGL